MHSIHMLKYARMYAIADLHRSLCVVLPQEALGGGRAAEPASHCQQHHHDRPAHNGMLVLIQFNVIQQN